MFICDFFTYLLIKLKKRLAKKPSISSRAVTSVQQTNTDYSGTGGQVSSPVLNR